MILVRPTEMPLRNAASWLLPTAYSDSPIFERETGIQITKTTTRTISAALGTKR